MKLLGATVLLLCWSLGAGMSCAGQPSVEEMAAQMLMVGFRGTELSDESPIIEQIRAGLVGNVILFERDMTSEGGPLRNISSPDQLRKLVRTLKSAAPGELPLWVGIDQEGGAVQRLRPRRGFAEAYPSARELGLDTISNTEAVARRLGRELADAEIDIDFAPAADLNVNPNSPAIGRLERSFDHDPERVAAHVLAFGEGLLSEGVVPCLKHFPGHGSAEDDTHEGAADVTKTWIEAELIPYRRAFEAGWRGAVMTSHVFHAALDPEYPASLSHAITTELLREKLGWDGVIVTDDLHMGALAQKYTMEEIVERAVNAGADILIFSGNARGTTFDPQFPQKAHETLVRLVQEGKIPPDRLLRSWRRIGDLKRKGKVN